MNMHFLKQRQQCTWYHRKSRWPELFCLGVKYFMETSCILVDSFNIIDEKDNRSEICVMSRYTALKTGKIDAVFCGSFRFWLRYLHGIFSSNVLLQPTHFNIFQHNKEPFSFILLSKNCPGPFFLHLPGRLFFPALCFFLLYYHWIYAVIL